MIQLKVIKIHKVLWLLIVSNKYKCHYWLVIDDIQYLQLKIDKSKFDFEDPRFYKTFTNVWYNMIFFENHKWKWNIKIIFSQLVDADELIACKWIIWSIESVHYSLLRNTKDHIEYSTSKVGNIFYPTLSRQYITVSVLVLTLVLTLLNKSDSELQYSWYSIISYIVC